MRLDFSKDKSIRSQWALNHATVPIRSKINHPPPVPSHFQGSWPRPVGDDDPLPPPPQRPELSSSKPSDDGTVTAAIIGAGAAGLFTAMIFDYLNTTVKGANIKYEIFEAENLEKRLGGRLFTHNFELLDPDDPKHNYFDVGAMRFPDASDKAPNPNPIMKRVFALFPKLDMNVGDVEGASIGDVVPYQMENDITVSEQATQQEYFCFNNITQLA